jgi:FdhE protein
MVEQHGENGEILHYVLLEVLKPVYERYGEAYGKQLVDATWAKPFCYVCGGAPDMAMLAGDGGKRYLCCRLCDTSWWYSRLKCPHCGNEDLEKLVSISLESEPAYMVHACKSCNRYLKVVDARIKNGDGLFLELEDLRTSYLDGVAQREGFTP